jgi:apolipoprotein D and lipocalin family protein
MSSSTVRALTLLASVLCAGCGGVKASGNMPLNAVTGVDLQKYLGTWHEQARYENRFQPADCVNVTADYALRSDGQISVTNRCRNVSGAVTDEAEGTAYVADTVTNAKLRVSFFWPFYGDYWIVALADDYSWVIVSEPDRDYLWILTRQADIPASEMDTLVEKATGLGFDKSRLIFSRRKN